MSYNPDFRERQAASAKAKAALLEKFRAAPGPDDPERKVRNEARLRIVEARKARAAEREAARITREKALAEEAAREAERRAAEERAAAEAAERAARLKVEEKARIATEQKAARDARYAARKAAKKQRRQQQKERPPLRYGQTLAWDIPPGSRGWAAASTPRLGRARSTRQNGIP